MQTIPETLIFPARTLSGNGRVKDLLPECKCCGSRGVLVHGKSLRESGKLSSVLRGKPNDLDIISWEHPGGEPSLDHLRALLSDARAFRAEWIAGVGGGSVLDLAKACAGLFHAGNDPVSYHDGNAIEQRGIPFVAVPTTAGTGSEATPNSVLINSDRQSKKSIRDDSFMAQLVILDGELLATCPRSVIAHSGMDALTQAFESFTSRKTTWFSDRLALKGLELVARNLPIVFENPSAPEAADLLLGSYLAGIALSLARLGVVHGLAHPLGVLYNQPHGLVCAVCLPHAVDLNRAAISAKYEEASALLGANFLEIVAELTTKLGIISPFKGKTIIKREAIISETLASGSTAGNPKKITPEDVNWLLERVF